MNKHFIIPLFASVLATLTLAAPPQFKQPSAEEIARIESAAPAKATAQPKKPRKVLIINQCEGFPHSSVPYGSLAFEVMGRKTGAFTTVVVDDLAILETPEFDTFDAIIMNNTTIKEPLLDGADEAREAKARERFLNFIRNGKGLIGVHAATDCLYKWPEYGEVIGGYFDGHPWNENVRVKLDDPGHPLLAAFKGLDFTVADEIYQFREYSRDALRVLMSLDASKTDMTKEGIKRVDKDFAVAWIHEYGKGRVFYFSLGHRHEIFWTPPILQCYLDGIQYALGDLPADATPSSKLKKNYLEKSRAAAFTAGMQSMLTELASYTLAGNISTAKQVDAFTDEHILDNQTNREALSRGLAQVAANPKATEDGRALACRKLSMVGTDNAVESLAALIHDGVMSNWALYALARMPGRTVDKALVAALKQGKGQAQLAVAALTGVRRVEAALPALAELATSKEDAAAVAAEAMGQIGGEAAIKALTKIQPTVNGPQRLAVDRALLNCAESARLAGKQSTAAQAYALLTSNQSAENIQAAAFYGSNLAAGQKGVKAAVEALAGSNTEMMRAGARLVKEMPDKSVAAQVSVALKNMPQDNQVIAISALAERGDRTAQEGVLTMLASKSPDVRISALLALEVLGDHRSVKPLMSIAVSEEIDKASRNAARKTLYLMNAPGVDQEIIQAMRAADLKAKVEYVKVLGYRKARVALPELFAAALDADPALAEEARSSISKTAVAKDLPEIVKLLAATSGTAALQQMEGIVVKAAKGTADEKLKITAVLNGLKQPLTVAPRCSLLTTLGIMGVSSTLPALTTAFKDSDAIVRRAAIKATAENWPDAVPLQALRDASLNDQDEQCRVLALAGYARMLAMPSTRPMKETLKLYREALDLAKGTQEKQALIIGLGSLVHRDALAFITPFFDDSNLQIDALQAALKITKGLNGSDMVLTSSQSGAERNALDGDPKTRWTTGSSTTGGEWFQVDLGFEDDIQSVYLDAGPVGNDQPQGYEVYVSLDGKEWGKPVAEGNDPKKRAFTINFNPKYGRFVKVIQTKPHGMNWSINEIRINGVPDLKSMPALDRTGWKASASNAPGNEQPQNAIDGDLTKRWGTGSAMKPGDWFAVDLGAEHTVHEVVMDAAQSGGDYPREYQIFTSLDGKTWYGPIGMGKGERAVTKATVLPTKARHVKIVQTGSTDNNWWSIYDLQILGE